MKFLYTDAEKKKVGWKSGCEVMAGYLTDWKKKNDLSSLLVGLVRPLIVSGILFFFFIVGCLLINGLTFIRNNGAFWIQSM